jgi:nucleoside phosphorylase
MSNPGDYTVAWICAIDTEYLAAQLCLDEEHPKLQRRPSPKDTNTYTLGKVSGHNIVIASLPDGSYGTSSAAIVAANLLRSFPNVRIGLMVGIGGGAPSPPDRDIRLGDIVVSSPRDGKGGVLQYDFGKTIQEQDFQETRFLNSPPTVLRTAVNDLKAELRRRPGSLNKAINSILENEEKDLREELSRPEASSDRLYRSDFVHTANRKSSCMETCGVDPSNLVPRLERTKQPPAVHYGLIASGNQLMKDALRRDELANKEKALCFEMEAAGLMDDFPCLVVRGICDYSDTHKNDEWQGYAALAAAVYSKALLTRIPPDYVDAEKRIADIVSGQSSKIP